MEVIEDITPDGSSQILPAVINKLMSPIIIIVTHTQSTSSFTSGPLFAQPVEKQHKFSNRSVPSVKKKVGSN